MIFLIMNKNEENRRLNKDNNNNRYIFYSFILFSIKLNYLLNLGKEKNFLIYLVNIIKKNITR